MKTIEELALLPILAIVSMLLLSAIPSISAQTPDVKKIEFSGLIAISRVDNVVQWRIVVDGSMTITYTDGTTAPYTGQYTVCKIWHTGEIIDVVPDVFLWRINRCQLKVNAVRLTVLWKAKPPTTTETHTCTFPEGDQLDFEGSWRAADVTGVFQIGQGVTHTTGWGYIIDGSGTLTLGS